MEPCFPSSSVSKRSASNFISFFLEYSPFTWVQALSDALMAVAREMVADSLEEYLDGLEYAAEGTYLEDLDEVTVRSDFRQLATDSVYYMLCRRCGLEPPSTHPIKSLYLFLPDHTLLPDG